LPGTEQVNDTHLDSTNVPETEADLVNPPIQTSAPQQEVLKHVNQELLGCLETNAMDDESRSGRTPARHSSPQPVARAKPLSRSSSASSMRLMIDERLEWANQKRARSASRDPSRPPSPFRRTSSFYSEPDDEDDVSTCEPKAITGCTTVSAEAVLSAWHLLTSSFVPVSEVFSPMLRRQASLSELRLSPRGLLLCNSRFQTALSALSRGKFRG